MKTLSLFLLLAPMLAYAGAEDNYDEYCVDRNGLPFTDTVPWDGELEERDFSDLVEWNSSKWDGPFGVQVPYEQDITEKMAVCQYATRKAVEEDNGCTFEFNAIGYDTMLTYRSANDHTLWHHRYQCDDDSQPWQEFVCQEVRWFECQVAKKTVESIKRKARRFGF